MFQQDDFDRAKSLFEKAVELSPQMPNTHFRLATVHSLMGNNAEVIVHAGKEIELNRKSFGSHRLLGDAYFQLEEYDKAREHFQTAVKINPDFAEAYYGLATLSARIGSKADSKRFREKFKSLHAKRQRSARDVRYSYNTHDALEKTRRSVARTHTEAGQIYQSHKNVKQAEKLWRRAAEIDRKNTKCRRALVSHCQGTGQLSEALRFSKQIRDCEPRNALHHLRVGDLNWQLQRHEDAAEDFNKVIELAPGRAEGYRALAQLYLQMNRDLPSVKQLAAKTTELEPTAQNFYWLSEVCNKCGDAKSRLAALQRASELAPDNPQYRRAYQLAKKGK